MDHPAGTARAPWLSLRTKTWLGLAVVAAVMLGFAAKIERLGYDAYRKDLDIEARIQLIDLRERIESEITDRVLAISEMAAILSEAPDLGQADFARRARSITDTRPDIISMAAARDLVVTLIYPLSGNEQVLGLDYRSNAAQWTKVKEAMQSRSGLMTGPVALVQGGRGLILRKPVLLPPSEGSTERRPWGLISVAIDFDAFIANLGLPEIERTYDILIREVPDRPGAGAVMLGSTDALDSDPVRLEFKFPFGRWELAAVLKGGWPTQRPDFEVRWLIRLLFVAAVVLSLRAVLGMARKQQVAESRLTNGIEALDHGFVMFGPDGKLVLNNAKYKQLHPMLGDPAVGTSYASLVIDSVQQGLVPDAVGREEEWTAEWFARQDQGNSEVEQIMPGGRVIRTSDRRMPDGSIVGLRIDVTDLKQAQLAAETANRAKTDFMGVLSHELRTPLTVILGQVRLARNIDRLPAQRALMDALDKRPDLAKDFTPLAAAASAQVTQMMEMAERSGTHLMTLINEVLDFAKIDSGNLSVSRTPLEIEEIVMPAVDQMRPLVENKGLTFDVTLEAAQTQADAKRIQQVLINLISNAAKFTDEGSIGLTVTANEEVIEIAVRDSGIGIPEHETARVFEPFHQVDSSATRRHGGTGLGLAISRDIALAHDGSLSVTSVEGEGSVFVLTLPRYYVQQIAAE